MGSSQMGLGLKQVTIYLYMRERERIAHNWRSKEKGPQNGMVE